MKGVEDALGRLEGVHSVRIDLQSNLVRIAPDPRFELRLEAVPRAIRGAGYDPGAMRVRARGRFEGARFRIHGWGRTLPVRVRWTPPSGETLLEAAVDDSSGEPVLVLAGG